jgi:hypothetical protein
MEQIKVYVINKSLTTKQIKTIKKEQQKQKIRCRTNKDYTGKQISPRNKSRGTKY